jgi:hypothetical protein
MICRVIGARRMKHGIKHARQSLTLHNNSVTRILRACYQKGKHYETKYNLEY